MLVSSFRGGGGKKGREERERREGREEKRELTVPFPVCAVFDRFVLVFDHTVRRIAKTEDEEDNPKMRHPVPAVHIGSCVSFLSSSSRVCLSLLSVRKS